VLPKRAGALQSTNFATHPSIIVSSLLNGMHRKSEKRFKKTVHALNFSQMLWMYEEKNENIPILA
jgi:hypothetical protein